MHGLLTCNLAMYFYASHTLLLVHYLMVLSSAEVVVSVIDEWMCLEHSWNNADSGEPKCSEKKTCPNATLHTTNSTLTVLCLNLGLCIEERSD
jgi:hypothetical protein